MTKQIFEASLQQYSQQLGLGGIRLDDIHGVCLEFDQKLELNLRWDPETRRVQAFIFCGHLPAGNNIPLMEAMLSANFLWIQTGGATLSIDAANNGILLTDKWDDTVYSKGDILKIYIENLVDHAEYWQNAIQEHAAMQGQHAAHSTPFNSTRI